MQASLIKEVEAKTIQAYVKNIPLNGMGYLFLSLMPFLFNPGFSVETYVGEQSHTIMGDIVSDNASFPEKRRDAIYKLAYDLSKISFKKTMSEKDFKRYIALRNTRNVNLSSIEDLVFNDVDAAIGGVMARLDWMCYKVISNGQITISKSNNDGVGGKYALDFRIPSANKIGSSVVWGTTATAVPFTDLKSLYDAADAQGVELAQFRMRYDDFQRMIACDSVQKILSLSMTGQSTIIPQIGLDQVNAYLGAIMLPPIVIDKRSYTLELQGVRSTIKPHEQYHVTGLPAGQLGTMSYGEVVEQGRVSGAFEAQNGPILIQKYSTPEPLIESTVGIANAFPDVPRVNEIFILDTNGTSFSAA